VSDRYRIQLDGRDLDSWGPGEISHEPLTPDEAEALLIAMARSLETSANPRPDRVEQAAIDKLRAIVGPERWASLSHLRL